MQLQNFLFRDVDESVRRHSFGSGAINGARYRQFIEDVGAHAHTNESEFSARSPFPSAEEERPEQNEQPKMLGPHQCAWEDAQEGIVIVFLIAHRLAVRANPPCACCAGTRRVPR